MRGAVTVLVVCSVGLVTWSCGQQRASDASDSRPKRTDRRTQTYDFGAARQGAILEHTFLVTNPGTAPLKVARVQTTCGCTAAKVAKNTVVEPGKSLELPVKLNLRGKKGAVESKVIVNYADGATPDEIVLKGTVAEEYPSAVDFPKVRRGEQPEQVVTLATFPGQPPLAVNEVRHDPDRFEVATRPGQNVGTIDLIVKPAANAPYGSVVDQIVVKTNDADAPEKAIMARAHIQKPLEAAERRLVLRPGADGEPVSAVVELKATYGGAISDVKASITREKRFSAVVEPDSPEGTVRVRVTYTPGDKKKDQVSANLTVGAKVGDEEFEEHVGVLYTAVSDGPGEKGHAESGETDGLDHDRF